MRSTPFLFVSALLLLAGCTGSSVREVVGLDRRSPDEFRVVARPPLSVPPQFDLKPPSLDQRSPTYVPADEKAQSLVTGKSVDTAVKPVESKPVGKITKGATAADSQFLKNIGAHTADPNVKQTLSEQRIEKQLEKEESGWWDTLSELPDGKEPIVKAEDEAKRIKENKAKGKPVNEGETPETSEPDTGILGRILGD